ncbi:hypothetical protein FBQ97_19180 [Acidobacteria bacterium ACD]|nr:MAG: hypothetical protein EDX89_18335 [Acidobacteriota bacterium]MCE7960344.1 hypothetical protein [Acidobacteria bacterium ACB2]MDL1951912.1 hypothetical protein [Acidobacteria bacterium ACD]
MTENTVHTSDPAVEGVDRRALVEKAAALLTLAATGLPLAALAQEKKDKSSSALGGIVKGVTSDPKVTNALVNVLKDALVTKDVKGSIAKNAAGVVFPQKEQGFLDSLSGSDLTGIAKFKDGLGSLDTGTATAVVKGVLGF